MTKHFPRFIYSNPENTKSKGPFIIHTRFPKVILKVEISDTIKAVPLEVWDLCTTDEIAEVAGYATNWYNYNIKFIEQKYEQLDNIYSAHVKSIINRFKKSNLFDEVYLVGPNQNHLLTVKFSRNNKECLIPIEPNDEIENVSHKVESALQLLTKKIQY